MIVKDEESVEQAVQMLESEGTVRYSDAYSYIIITSPGTLEYQCRHALERNDIAIVVPRGHEREMENYAQTLTRVRKERAVKERENIKEWVKEHPEQVEKFEKKMKRKGEE